MDGVLMKILCFMLVIINGTAPIQIENESYIRQQATPDLYTTAQTPQIQPTAENMSTTNTPTVPMPLQTIAAILSLEDILKQTRPTLLAPEQMQRNIDQDYFPERKNFYTQTYGSKDETSIKTRPKQHDSISKHYIDYRKVYGIRYDPNKNRRSFATIEQSSAENSTEVSETPIDSVDGSDVPFASLNDPANSDNNGDDADIMNSDQSELIVNDGTVETTADQSGTATTISTMPAASSENEVIEDTVAVTVATANQTVQFNPGGTLVPTATTPPSTATHIMTPSRVHTTLQLIKQRVTNLLANGLYTDPNNGGQRFLSLFNVIKFANVPCSTGRPPLTPLNGTCYNQQECDELGGVAVDECANGFGVCCVCECSWLHAPG